MYEGKWFVRLNKIGFFSSVLWLVLFVLDHSYFRIFIVDELINVLYLWIERRLQKISRPDWVLATIFGDKSLLPYEVGESFKSLGIYHLLVVSGLHVGFFYFGVRAFADLSLRLIYGFRLMGPRAFHYLSALFKHLSIYSALIFCSLSNFGPSGVRALIFILISTSYFPWALSSRMQRYALVLFIQAITFPESLVSLSFILSWSIFLIISHAMSVKSFGRVAQVKAILWANLKIAVVVCACVGQFSAAGIFLNLGASIFGAFLFYLNLSCLLGASWPKISYFHQICTEYIEGLCLWAAAVSDEFYWDSSHFHHISQVSFVILSAIIIYRVLASDGIIRNNFRGKYVSIHYQKNRTHRRGQPQSAK